ncbi:hypothetical protein, partial [Bacillus amyloliquefaciens]|uniref:hypothetical protein n=1 Tax=Bacillus amyloliquefaciens TaxID=1390 RepID=UPI001404DFDF
MDVIDYLSECHFKSTYEEKAEREELEHEKEEELHHFEDFQEEDLNYVLENFELLDMTEKDESYGLSIEKPAELELKMLPDNLKYVFLGKSSTLPVIISSQLTETEDEKLIEILKKYKKA